MAYEPSKNIISAPKKISAKEMNDGTLDIRKDELIAICSKWNNMVKNFVGDFGKPEYEQVWRDIGNKEINQLFNDYVNFVKTLGNLKQAISRKK